MPYWIEEKISISWLMRFMTVTDNGMNGLIPLPPTGGGPAEVTYLLALFIIDNFHLKERSNL